MKHFYSELQQIMAVSKALHTEGYFNSTIAAPVQEAGKGSEHETMIANFEHLRKAMMLPEEQHATQQMGTAFHPTLPRETGSGSMDELAVRIKACTMCARASQRIKVVAGVGAVTNTVLVLGDQPGNDEDLMGLPFVGAAGQFLDKWLEAIGLSRYKNCYLTNVMKCRSPGVRHPAKEQLYSCLPWLEAQVVQLAPRAILVLGPAVFLALFPECSSDEFSHGLVREWKGISCMMTYHPATVLQDPALKKPVWDDLKLFRGRFLDDSYAVR